MSNIKAFPKSTRGHGSTVDKGGEPPDNPGMEARVKRLEDFAQDARERLVRIEAKQDEFIKHFATKADVADAKNSIIMWVVSAILLAQLLPALLKKFGL
jgi:intein-encoded DNA endonuclease-like protein